MVILALVLCFLGPLMILVDKWFTTARPISLFESSEPAKASEPAQSSTARLYVLRVDFPMTDTMRKGIDMALDPLREKYGIDFFVLEPGIKLSRFDDI